MHYVLCLPLGGKNSNSELERLKKKLSGLCECCPLSLPALKVGTLDSLLGLSDDLSRFDATVENISQKFLRQWDDVVDNKKNFYATVDLVDVRTRQTTTVPVPVYLQNFAWDQAQYSINKSLRELAESIAEKITKMDDEIKNKISDYNNTRNVLQTLDRKDKGSLQSRALYGIVTKDHVVESEYLTTLFVVVPRSSYKEWQNKFNKLGDIQYIVPDYTEKIAEDGEYGLFNVVLFRKFVEDYKNQCKMQRFNVRDFQFDENIAGEDESKRKELEEKMEKLKRDLVRLCKTGFSESFTAWFHIKVIRAYVESILRYGLPPEFLSVLLKCKNNEKKVHAAILDQYPQLNEEFTNFVGKKKKQQQQQDIDVLTAGGASYGMEFLPFVFVQVNTENPLLHVHK